LWTYDKARVAYVVEGSRVIATHTLPGDGAKSATSEPKKDEPIPAERVDEP
jgi:hypothetical protein